MHTPPIAGGVIDRCRRRLTAESKIPSALRQFARADGLTDDLRLSIALKTLNPSMPLIVRGNIVTPG
jgi:hypothetical protein